jgi:thiol-disulfide isomerase/thioredoxin
MVSLAILSCSQQGKGNADQTANDRQGNGTEELTKQEQANEAGKNLAPDFALKDMDGNSLRLSSLRGKYVVLDFWGSWCVWCIKGFPKMKEYYEKYADRLEILGIDCHDAPEDWIEAVRVHQLPWRQVYMPDESPLLEKYGIRGFPTKVIISPDGEMVNTFVGESEDFYAMLDRLFQ